MKIVVTYNLFIYFNNVVSEHLFLSLPLRVISCSVLLIILTSRIWSATCSSLPTPWPWPCLCWSPSRCVTPSTGQPASSQWLKQALCWCWTQVNVSFVLLQSVGESVSAAHASLGELLAAGSHLPLHVSAFPHPLRRAAAGTAPFMMYLSTTDH